MDNTLALILRTFPCLLRFEELDKGNTVIATVLSWFSPHLLDNIMSLSFSGFHTLGAFKLFIGKGFFAQVIQKMELFIRQGTRPSSCILMGTKEHINIKLLFSIPQRRFTKFIGGHYGSNNFGICA